MRPHAWVPAALLLSSLCFACAHHSADAIEPGASAELELDASGRTANADTALEQAEAEAEAELETDEFETGPEATVISFEDNEGDKLDTVIAPPKRKQIPGFELFGTGDTASTEGPKLTLPPDME